MTKKKKQMIPLVAAVGLLLLEFSALTLGADLGMNNAHAEGSTTTTNLSLDVPLVLAITSNTSKVTIGTENLDTFYTGTASVSATTNNQTGYTLTMANNDTNTSLVNDDYDSTTAGQYAGTIDSIASNITVDSTGSNFTVNKWGYAIDSAPSVFKPIPTSTAAEEVKKTTEAGSGSATVTFGTKVDGDLVAGSYEDTVVFSLTANFVPPKKLKDLTSMQQLADYPEACTNTEEHGSAVLEDLRDGQQYTVFKAKDGNCWMGENLRYGVNPDGTGHPFVAADAALSDSGLNSTKMLDLTYDSSNPNTAGRIKNGASGMKTADNSANAFADNTENYTEPYINIYQANDVAAYDGQTKYGVLYNYCAVTGGTACTDSSTDYNPTGSVCPKGWKLPGMTANPTGSGATTDGSVKTYNNLFNAYGVTNNASGFSVITSSPLFFVRAGFSSDGSIGDHSSSGSGSYWSSTKYASTSSAYRLYVDSSSVTRTSRYRYYGISSRCVSE